MCSIDSQDTLGNALDMFQKTGAHRIAVLDPISGTGTAECDVIVLYFSCLESK